MNMKVFAVSLADQAIIILSSSSDMLLLFVPDNRITKYGVMGMNDEEEEEEKVALGTRVFNRCGIIMLD